MKFSAEVCKISKYIWSLVKSIVRWAIYPQPKIQGVWKHSKHPVHLPIIFVANFSWKLFLSPFFSSCFDSEKIVEFLELSVAPTLFWHLILEPTLFVKTGQNTSEIENLKHP